MAMTLRPLRLALLPSEADLVARLPDVLRAAIQAPAHAERMAGIDLAARQEQSFHEAQGSR